MNDVKLKFNLVKQVLEFLNTKPLDLERVSLIRDQDSQYLSNPANLESLILSLGLNDEGLHEFPKKLYPYCGQGLRIWQYPVQFSKYLVALSKLNITSYLELGVRHGGTFVTTVEYLQKFNTIKYAVGVDIIACPSLLEYKQLSPNAEFAKIDTQSKEFQQMLARYKKFDLVLIDSIHEEIQCRSEFLSVKEHANVIAFHDIAHSKYPGVKKVWDEVKSLGEYECSEYTDRYEEIEASSMGIGLAVKKHR